MGGAVPAQISRLCSLTRSSDISRFRERFAYLGARWPMEWLNRVSQEREQEAQRWVADVERKMADTLAQVRAAEIEAETRIAEAQAQARAEAESEIAAAQARIAEAQAQARAEAESEIAAARTRSRRRRRRLGPRRSLRLPPPGRARGGAGRDRAEAERLVAEATAKVLSATQQLQVEQRGYESEIASLRGEIQAIVDSTIWRASAPLRIAASRFPSSLKPAARGGLRAIYWVLTPWAMPRRIRVLRERFRQRQEAVAPDGREQIRPAHSSAIEYWGTVSVSSQE